MSNPALPSINNGATNSAAAERFKRCPLRWAMCSNYRSLTRADRLLAFFGVTPERDLRSFA